MAPTNPQSSFAAASRARKARELAERRERSRGGSDEEARTPAAGSAQRPPAPALRPAAATPVICQVLPAGPRDKGKRKRDEVASDTGAAGSLLESLLESNDKALEAYEGFSLADDRMLELKAMDADWLTALEISSARSLSLCKYVRESFGSSVISRKRFSEVQHRHRGEISSLRRKLETADLEKARLLSLSEAKIRQLKIEKEQMQLSIAALRSDNEELRARPSEEQAIAFYRDSERYAREIDEVRDDFEATFLRALKKALPSADLEAFEEALMGELAIVPEVHEVTSDEDEPAAPSLASRVVAAAAAEGINVPRLAEESLRDPGSGKAASQPPMSLASIVDLTTELLAEPAVEANDEAVSVARALASPPVSVSPRSPLEPSQP